MFYVRFFIRLHTVVFFKTVPILKLAPNPLRTPSEPPQNMIFFQNLHSVLIRTPPEPPQNPPRMDFQFEVRVLQVTFWVVHKVLDSTIASSNLRSFCFVKSDHTLSKDFHLCIFLNLKKAEGNNHLCSLTLVIVSPNEHSLLPVSQISILY